jgi:glutaredoxin
MDLDKGTSVFSQGVVPSSFTKVTVYSKSGCGDCEKVKMYLEDLVSGGQMDCNDVVIVNCDSHIANDRDQFVSDIMKITGKTMVVFPMVFVNDRFIGGFKATLKHFESTLSTFEKSGAKQLSTIFPEVIHKLVEVEQNTVFNLDSTF